MRFVYGVLIQLVRPFAFGLVLWRGFGNRRYWAALRERFGFGPQLAGRSIWVHAVSLGEVNAAAPLVGALLARHAELHLVLTTATPTGRERAHSLFGDVVDVRFVPYDTGGSMRRLIARCRPVLVIIMETELWPNLFHECRRRRIPVVLANARLSARSVGRYRWFGSLFRDVFEGTHVAAQSAADAGRFLAIGAHPGLTQVLGNLKFDVALDAAGIERGRRLRATAWLARPVWIAGSTHAGEEEIVLAAHAALTHDVPAALLLLVPRHPERFEGVADLLKRRGMRFERRSSATAVLPDTGVLLVDSVGELGMLYAAADVAFVGGSLVPVGGHNLLEPAALGLPVIIGPHQANNRESAALLLAEGGALQVSGAESLATALEGLFSDADRRLQIGAQARRVVEMNRGSLTKLLELIDPILSAAR